MTETRQGWASLRRFFGGGTGYRPQRRAGRHEAAWRAKAWWLVGAWLALMPLAQAETTTYYVTNAQGTVVATMDRDAHVTYTAAYRPYGSQVKGVPQAGPGYTGHVNDPDTGLVYMQQRYYDPGVGGFISPDPIGPAPGNVFNFGRYTYANDNPIRYTDPDGRCPKNISNCVEPVPPSFFRDTVVGRFLASSVGNTAALFTKDNINPLNDQYVGSNDLQDAKLGILTLAVPASRVESGAAGVLKPVLQKTIKKSAVAIGEDMEGRVIPFAKKIGADWYKPDSSAPPSKWMENNRKWINGRMDEGCKIIDCGAAPGRTEYPEPTSPYYRMERSEIWRRQYKNYSKQGVD